MNAEARRMYGSAPGEDIQKRPSDILQMIDFHDASGRLLSLDELPEIRAARGERVENLELHAHLRDTGTDWIGSFNAVPICIENSNVSAVLVFFREITRFKEIEKSLHQFQEQYQALFEKMTEGFALGEIICNKRGAPCDYRFLEINPAFEKLTGLSREIIGKRFKEILPGEDPKWIEKFGKVALTGETANFENYSQVLRRHYEVFAYRPAPLQFAVLFNDISERKRVGKFLQEYQEKLKLTQTAARIGTFVWDIQTDEAIFSEEFETIYGFPPGGLENKYENWERCIHPDDLNATQENIRKNLDEKRASPTEFRIIRPDGSIRWIATWGQMLLDSKGQPLKMVGLNMDITERKEMEETLRETQDYLERLINYANAPIIVWDPSFRILRFNHSFERLTGLNSSQVIGKPLDILFPEAIKEEAMAMIQKTLSGEHWETVEIPIQQKDGNIRTVLWNSANILDKRKAVIATIAQGQDITERILAEKKIKDSLKEKEMLLRELHHRIKNNMQVISSLISLQIASVKESAIIGMFDEMQKRILTMSLVHEKLYQSSDLSNLDMREYISDLAETILSSHRKEKPKIHLRLDIENIPVSIDTAIPCGMIVNELISNSLKYAFPERDAGEIRISLRSESGNRLALEFYDNGIGFPKGFDPARARSLGLKLVYNLAAKQLRGDVEFQNRNGARVLIRLEKTSP